MCAVWRAVSARHVCVTHHWIEQPSPRPLRPYAPRPLGPAPAAQADRRDRPTCDARGDCVSSHHCPPSSNKSEMPIASSRDALSSASASTATFRSLAAAVADLPPPVLDAAPALAGFSGMSASPLLSAGFSIAVLEYAPYGVWFVRVCAHQQVSCGDGRVAISTGGGVEAHAPRDQSGSRRPAAAWSTWNCRIDLR